MTDGAHQGIGAHRAIETILGGKEPPTRDEGMTPEQMRAFLESGHADDAYSEASRVLGGQFLAFLDAHPEHWSLPVDDAWHFPKGAADPSEGHVTRKGLYALMTESGVVTPGGLTGFMVGWAANAAKYALGVPPAPNPALLEIG